MTKRNIKRTNSFYVLFILVLIQIICFSCEDKLNSDLGNESNQRIEKDEIEVKNGMLVFSSMQELDKVATELHTLINEQQYADIADFKSQKSIFDQIILAEDEFIEECLKLPEDEIKKMDPNDAHSDLYLEMRKKGIIKEFEEDGEISYDYALCDPIYASVVNEDGFVAVGDTVLYIEKDKVVRCDGIELRNANTLKFATETDSLAKIYVLNTNIETRSTNEQYPQIKYADTFRDGKKYRYSLHLHFDLAYFLKSMGDYKQMAYRYYIAAKSKKQKALFGGYNYRSCKGILSGGSRSQAKAYQYVSSVYDMGGSTTVSPYETSISNTIFRLSFWKDINTTKFWTWDSLQTLSFSLGSTDLTIMSVIHSYNYKCVFEGNNTVSMSGTLLITPPKTIESN